MREKLVIDTCSLINFLRYYYFDKENSSTIYNKLVDFLIEKIEIGEIIVIDKVFVELKDDIEREKLKKMIKPYVKDTLFLFDKVQKLINESYIPSAAKQYYNDSSSRIDIELKKYENDFADLYLVAYCQYLIEMREKTILITEEGPKADKKLIEKIPKICRNNHIQYRNLPYSLFTIYKDELKFDLAVYIKK